MAARSFAHLVGLGRRPAAAAAAENGESEDERERREEREDAAHAERDEEMRRRAENGEDTGESEDEERERERRESRRAARRRAQGEDENENDDDGDEESDQAEMRGHGTIARARARERGRVAAILGSPRAASNLPLAVELACNSAMSRDQALGILARTPPALRAERAAKNPQLGGGDAPAPGGGSSRIQSMWGEAFARVVPAMRQNQGRFGR